MKTNRIISALLVLTLMAGCGQKTADADIAEAAESTPVIVETVDQQEELPPEENQFEEAQQEAEEVNVEVQTETETEPVSEEKQKAQPEAASAPVQESAPAPTSAPTQAPAATPAPAPAASLAYGAIPFDLAASTGTWWQIDSTDSAYWAVRDNINSIRAAGGLGALSVDGGLSSIADSRCRSFVEGGAFDHSGMATKSEICARGPLGSASSVCSAWQSSPDHYSNIMRTDISRMGIACWFCQENGSQYTYWTVTFE